LTPTLCINPPSLSTHPIEDKGKYHLAATMMLSKVVMSLLTVSLAAAHMEMSWPYPLRSRFDPQVPEEDIDYSMTSPLNSDGASPLNHKQDGSVHG
jgi:hypothetical protein